MGVLCCALMFESDDALLELVILFLCSSLGGESGKICIELARPLLPRTTSSVS